MRGKALRAGFAALAALGVAAPAGAITIATFQNPATGLDAADTLFTITNTTVTSGWTHDNLYLTLWNGVTHEVTMTATNLTRTGNTLTGGDFAFTDYGTGHAFFEIDFNSAHVGSRPTSVYGDNINNTDGVSFYYLGHLMTGLSKQKFGFGLQPGVGAHNYTGTLQCTAVPEPFTLILGAAALALGIGRRRTRKF